MPSDIELLSDRLDHIIRGHLSRIAEYVPGHGRTAAKRVTSEQIARAFAADPLYSIFGLDSPEYISATFAGGTITSIHRKIGDLYEDSIQEIFKSSFSLSKADISYTANIASGEETRQRQLDCFLRFDILSEETRERVRSLAERGFRALSPAPNVTATGIGFEIRHCYQSADSKRAQADDAMAMHCAVSGILPVMLVFCNQSNRQIIRRYTQIWYVREGRDSYDLVKNLSGFDFYDFLAARKKDYRQPVIEALRRIQPAAQNS